MSNEQKQKLKDYRKEYYKKNITLKKSNIIISNSIKVCNV